MSFHIYRTVTEDVIRDCQKNNRHAQRFLYDYYVGKMMALARRYVKDTMVAEDILVTAFTKVFKHISRFKGEGSFEGWIRRIVVNEALTWLRKNKSMYLETDIEMAASEVNYDQLGSAMAAEELMKMVEALPTGYRIVFNLYAIDGYSHQEIAEQLGISENTSKSQLSRARAVLQRQLSKMEAHRNITRYETGR
jgi:RNA polymerase sigma-70 factor (ECF subfamily)